MAILKPDSVRTENGVTVNEYLLTKHNPHHIAMPTASMNGKVIGVTIHNTGWIKTAPGTSPSEQYTRATVNGNMNDVRVHYYVDDKCAWQNLPHTLSGWHAADGSGNGNRKTIAIECIMSSHYNDTDKKSEDNAARLAAALLKEYGLGIDRLYTHTHWLNVRDGKRGTTDQLNTMYNKYKTCPLYIIPHWDDFKSKVIGYMSAESKSNSGNASNTTQNAPVGSFLVKVVCNSLNVRSGAGVQYKVNTVVHKGEVFTIVETSGNWGKLKSGAGWINISASYCKKV